MDTSRSYLEPSSFSKKLAATIIIVYTVITLIPISWMVMTSFKNVNSAISYPPEVLFEPSLEGYVNLFTNRSRQSQEYLDSLPAPETWYEELVRSREMVIAGPSKYFGRYANSLIIGFGATFLSVFLLKNPIGIHRILAIIICCIGTLLIIKPSIYNFNWFLSHKRYKLFKFFYI